MPAFLSILRAITALASIRLMADPVFQNSLIQSRSHPDQPFRFIHQATFAALQASVGLKRRFKTSSRKIESGPSCMSPSSREPEH